MLKFMWNGIKVEGKLYPAWYSKGSYTPESGISEGTITIYAKKCQRFPVIDKLTIENDSDMMTDYFENDKIRVTPENVWYPFVLDAYHKQEIHHEKRSAKQLAKG